MSANDERNDEFMRTQQDITLLLARRLLRDLQAEEALVARRPRQVLVQRATWLDGPWAPWVLVPLAMAVGALVAVMLSR